MADTGKAKRDAGDAEEEEEEEEEGGDSLAPLPAVGRPSRGGSRGSLTAGAGAGAGASNDTAAVPTASAAPPPPPAGSGGGRKSRARSRSGGKRRTSVMEMVSIDSMKEMPTVEVNRDSEVDKVVKQLHAKQLNNSVTRDRKLETDHVMKYVYAVVLHNKVRPDGSGLTVPELRQCQEWVIEVLVRSHLECVVLADSKRQDSDGKLVILVRELSTQGLHKESKRMAIDDLLQTGEDTALQDVAEMTPAEKLMLTHRVVDRALTRVRDSSRYFRALKVKVEADHRTGKCCGRVVAGAPVEWLSDVIASSGPLHDTTFNNHFFTEFRACKTFCTWDLDNLIANLRTFYGERVAFYFFFMNYYTKWLLPLMAFMVLYYFAVRFASWGGYVAGLGVLGFLVPVVWGKMFAIGWRRKTERLLFEWDISEIVMPDVPNPYNPEYELVYNEELKGREKKYDPKNWRLKLTLLLPVFTLINMALLALIATPFIQWYVFSKLVPTCDCCNWWLDNNGPILPNGTLTAPMQNAAGNPIDCSLFVEEAMDNMQSGNFIPPDSCTYFVSCFNAVGGTVGTDRWLYILVQGILLGLVMDVAQLEFFVWATGVVTRKESWATEMEFESHLIHKQYLFCWFNMFFWFLWIGFVYVPFGSELQSLLVNLGFGWAVPGFGWRSGVVNIDEAFLTPLLATQSINLALETIIPWICHKREHTRTTKRKAADVKVRDSSKAELTETDSEDDRADDEAEANARRASIAALHSLAAHGAQGAGAGAGAAAGAAGASDVQIKMSSNPLSTVGKKLSTREHTPGSLVRYMAKKWKRKVKVLRFTDDDNKYDAKEVVDQLKKEPFHPRKDYLDMMMQFGYVAQFTVCWALSPVPAVVNNLLEIRGDVLKMITGHSRPVPVRERGTGEWEAVIDRAVFFATIVVIGFIVVGTGALEWFFNLHTVCIGDSKNAHRELMTPDLVCVASWGYRLLAGVVLYVVALVIWTYIEYFYQPIEEEVRETLENERTIRNRQKMDSLLPQLPNSFAGNLRILFQEYDDDDNNMLQPEECIPLFDDLNKVSRELAKAKHKTPPRRLEGKDHEALFEILDADGSQSVGFAEAAMAISRCQDDPLLGDAIGFYLEKATKELARRIMADPKSKYNMKKKNE